MTDIVKEKPFEARYKWIHRKKLPNGQVSTVTEIGAVYRDTNGRERREEHLEELGKLMKITADIYDPPGNTVYYLDMEAKTVLLKDELYATSEPPASWSLSVNLDDNWAMAIPRGSVPDNAVRLGQTRLNGLRCDGYRLSERGRYLIEYWISEELQETLLLKVVTQSKESTYQLFDIRLEAPDQHLFAVPADYKDSFR